MRILRNLLVALDRLAAFTGLANVPLDADELCRRALHAAGRERFSDNSFRAPMALLIDCYEREANLNIFGRRAAKWDALRCLSNLLRFEEEEERNPAIFREKIDAPIFITGFPRSGTTLLHTLLSEDRGLNIPRCYQTVFPYPPKSGVDRRVRQVDGQLQLFERLAPQMTQMHPLVAQAPQECTEITSQVFRSLRYEGTHYVPTYQRWIDREGHEHAYRFHKRYLQHLQHQQGRKRWVLKCPDHIHALDTIGKVYPDCGIVFVHRDPLRVTASAMKLTEVLRRPFTRSLDKTQIGRQVLDRVIEAAVAMVDMTRTPRGSHIFHIHHDAFAREPLATMEALYRHFGMVLSPETRARMTERLAATPHVQHRYRFDEYGQDPAALCSRLRFYMERFYVKPEFDAWREAVPQAAA